MNVHARRLGWPGPARHWPPIVRATWYLGCDRIFASETEASVIKGGLVVGWEVVGFGRIVGSEIWAPNMFVNLV